MAGQTTTIDPSALTSWEDAFQHPLPVVRKLEHQLRRTIDENREKLRSLVGASYRDLLGTAERIITMDEQMSAVEMHLGEIGKRCNTRTLERVVDNSARMRRAREDGESGRYAVVAQTKVLQSALAVVGRVVKTGGDALLAAKVLVLARLLHKSASESPEAPQVLDSLRRKLVALRKKLLSYIERALVRPPADKMMLAHTLGAYALVTSSTPKDVLRHFLQLRYEQLDTASESTSDVVILQMLELYSQTLLDTRDLFPRRFAEILSQLARAPLLQDEQIRSVFELNLDIYGSWIAEDVRAFTPWVRHDQLGTSEVTDALAAWTRQAQECLLQGLEACLQDQHDAASILDVRQKVLTRYLALSSKLRQDGHGQAVQALRRTFLKRLEKLAYDSAHSVRLSLEPSGPTTETSPTQDLWSLASSSDEISRGGIGFRKAVLSMRHGRSSAIEGQTQILDAFFGELDTFWAAAEAMRSSKWDEAVDFDLDDLDDGEALQKGLIKQDPDELEAVLRQATGDAVGRIYEHIREVSATTTQPTFIIRILRELDQRVRGLGDHLAVPIAKLRDGSIATTLQRSIADQASRTVIDAFVLEFQRPSSVAFALWEGTPPLPVQPSAVVFRFLIALHRAMADVGNDLWSPACITQLKSLVKERVVAELEQVDFDAVADDKSKLTNGHAESEEETPSDKPGPSPAEDEHQAHRRLQRYFDMVYLQRAMTATRDDKKDGKSLNDFVTKLRREADVDDAVEERLRKSVREYWTRTFLLFGLLASDRR